MEKYEIDKTKRFLLEHESGRIYTTKCYDEFKRLKGNRDVAPSRWLSIAKSIKKVGYIQSPIVINEKFEVIDGQGRLSALRHLNLPVEFVISPGAGIEECISMNISGGKWTDEDFIKSHAELGNSNYIKLLQLMTDFSASASVLSTALYKTSRFQSSSLRMGDIIITDEEFEKAKSRMAFMKQLFAEFDIKYYKVAPKILEQALLYVIDFDKVKNDRLLSIMKDGIKLPKSRFYTVDDIVEGISAAYDFNLREENKAYISMQFTKLKDSNKSKHIKEMNAMKKARESNASIK